MIVMTIATIVSTKVTALCGSSPRYGTSHVFHISLNIQCTIIKKTGWFPSPPLCEAAWDSPCLSNVHYSYGPQEPSTASVYGPSAGASALLAVTVIAAIPLAFIAVIS